MPPDSRRAACAAAPRSRVRSASTVRSTLASSARTRNGSLANCVSQRAEQAGGERPPLPAEILDRDGARGSSRAARGRAAAAGPRLEPMHEEAALAVAAEMGEHACRAAPSRRTRRTARPARRAPASGSGTPGAHDGHAAAHARDRRAGASCAMKVRHHKARLRRYHRFDPSAVCMTRSTSAASSRSVSAQKLPQLAHRDRLQRSAEQLVDRDAEALLAPRDQVVGHDSA